MAPKQARQSIREFVQSREAAANQRISEEQKDRNADLKCEYIKHAQANIAQTRINGPHRRDQDLQPRILKQPPDEQPHLWDTDASSIGGTSETPIMHADRYNHASQVPPPPHDAQHVRQHTNGQLAQHDSEGSAEDYVSDFSHPPEDLPGLDNAPTNPMLTSEAMRKMRAFDLERQAGMTLPHANEDTYPPGRALPYIKGDSYPPSTSGPPSHIVPDAGQTHPPTQQHHVAAQVPQSTQYGLPQHPVPQRTRGQAQAEVQNRPQSPPRQQDNSREFATAHRMRRTGASEHLPLDTAARASNPGLKRHRETLAVDEDSHRPIASQSRDTMDTRKAQQSTTARSTPLNGPLNAVPAAVGPFNAAERSLQGQSHAQVPPDDGDSSEASPPRSQQPRDTGITSHGYEREGLPASLQHPEPEVQGHNMPPAEQRTMPLDYDTSQLFKMNFSALKEQAFDHGPDDEQHNVPGVAHNDPIEAQMEAAAKLDQEMQFAFVSSLTINDWEQAGEWFLEKFSETLSKLKKVRQDKRMAAQGFENEIESRHVAVNKKRKLTEVALNELKATGNMILQGTPNKTRKTK